MKKILVLFFYIHLLFGLNIKEINSDKPIEKLDFNNTIYIVPADYIKFVFNHKNIKIVGIKGLEDGIILTRKKKLNNIKTIANANLAANIVLKSVNNDYRAVKASFDDFLNDKVDAIYLPNKSAYIEKNLYTFHLKRLLFFPKKIIIGDINYLKKQNEELYVFKHNLKTMFNALILSKYYYHNLIPMNNIVYFKYPKTKFIKVYVTPNWPPFELDENGKLKGIGIEFWKLIAQKANIDYVLIKDNNWSDILNKIKLNVADVTPSTSETEDRKKFAYFSKTYASFPLGVVCKKGMCFKSMEDINTVAVGKDYTPKKL